MDQAEDCPSVLSGNNALGAVFKHCMKETHGADAVFFFFKDSKFEKGIAEHCSCPAEFIGVNFDGVHMFDDLETTQFPNIIPSPDAQCEGITCSIIWARQPHQCTAVKTCTAKNCALCAKGKNHNSKTICSASRSNPQLLINSSNVFCSACRH